MVVFLKLRKEAGLATKCFLASAPRPTAAASLSKKFWDAAGKFTTLGKKPLLRTPLHAQPMLLLFGVA